MKKMIYTLLISLLPLTAFSQIIIDDNFATWANGKPAAWGRSDTITRIFNDVNRAKIIVSKVNDAVISGMDIHVASNIVPPKKIQVTIQVDSISNPGAYKFVVEGWSAGNKTTLLKKGLNVFTFDLTFPTNYFYFDDNIDLANAGIYPHVIIIASVKVESI